MVFSIARFGSCHVGYITKHTSIDPAHGSRAAAALEKKGLIARVPDPKNKRRKLVSLSASGMEIFERVWPKARGILAEKTDLLTRDELSELKRLLDLINGAGPAVGTAQPARNGSAVSRARKKELTIQD